MGWLLYTAWRYKEKLFTDCWLRDLPYFVTEVLQLWDVLAATICPVNQVAFLKSTKWHPSIFSVKLFVTIINAVLLKSQKNVPI